MDEKEVILNEIVWDRPHYFLNGAPFSPVIYEGDLENIPDEFNTYTIKLDGTSTADLSWKKEKELAQAALNAGYALFWSIDLGLFEKLPMPLDNQAQFLSLTLSLEHFRDSLWKEFKAKTIGLSIYRGSVDFSLGFAWDAQQVSNFKKWLKELFQNESQFEKETGLSLTFFEEATPQYLQRNQVANQFVRLFCRDASVEYLSLLSTRLPDSLPCYLFLDVSSISNSLSEAQLLNPERFEHLNLALRGNALPWEKWIWEQDKIVPRATVESTVGVCFPPMEMNHPNAYRGMDKALTKLTQHSIPFRIIAENHLITCWDGLDYLIYVPTGLSYQGKRKLQGFCAAGGTVVTLELPLGLSNEITFADFINLETAVAHLHRT